MNEPCVHLEAVIVVIKEQGILVFYELYCPECNCYVVIDPED